MKIFSIHIVRNVMMVVVALGIGYAAYVINPKSVTGPNAEAGTTDNISGWAWANTPQSSGSPQGGLNQGIGWISMNSTTDGSSYSYGVNVDQSLRGNTPPGIGNFSGRAWGSNIGWITFNLNETSGNIGTSYCVSKYLRNQAQVDWYTGKVSGWARALSGSTVAGGWDGCILLSDDSPTSTWAGQGVTINNNEFSGWAWGSNTLGWIDFKPTINGINVGPRLSSTSCSEQLVNSSGLWGTCSPIKTCDSSNAGQTFNNTAGTRLGTCSAQDGGGQVLASCNTVLVCPATSVSPPSGAPAKKKFWQF